ncbi:hypothetical protein C8R44DRAFT_740775 [Mycena epipterygia]|nr:hypothetical protein C8R44DRAFT_740775 [Mycena epipterygia]
MAQFSNQNGISDGLLERILHHVAAEKVPWVVKAPVENDVSERAWASFVEFEQGLSSQCASHPDFRARLITAWPGIFQWCCYFSAQRVSPFTAAQKPITTICTLIRDLYLDPEVRATIRATPGIILLCTSLWLRPASPPIASILFLLLQTDTWDDMDEVVTASGENPAAIAKIILDRLRTATSQSPMLTEPASTLTSILMTLTSLPNHPLAFAILADNATWVVARMLFFVSYVIGPSPNPRDKYFACIRTGIAFLRRALVQHESPRLVSQALDAGLLRAICVLSSVLRVEQSSEDSLRFILRDILPKSMVYLSVIKVMKRVQDEIERDVPDTTCTNKGTKSELLRCSGCLYVYYCSKVCQMEAWPIHREMCKLKKHANDKGGRLFFSPQNAQFLRELVSSDANIHFFHLQQLARRKFPNEPGENLIICIDYTDPRYPAGTCSLKNVRTYVFPPVTSEAADPANVQAQNDEMIKMVRRNPAKFTFIEASFMYGERRLTRNIILRPNMWVQPPAPDLHSTLNWQNNQCENHDGPALGSLLERFMHGQYDPL